MKIEVVVGRYVGGDVNDIGSLIRGYMDRWLVGLCRHVVVGGRK